MVKGQDGESPNFLRGGDPLHLNREGWACLAFPNTLGELVSAHPSPTISPNSPLSSEILHPRPHSLTLR